MKKKMMMGSAMGWVLGISLGLGMVSPSSVSGATREEITEYLTMGAPVVREVTDARVWGELPKLHTSMDADEPGFGFEAGFDLTNIINLGKKIWQIVEAGKPVVNVELNTANALPEGAKGWQALEGWQAPVSRVFEVSYKNGFGREMVNFTYRLLYTYGGNSKGKGHYLTNVTVVPAQLSVGWGYSFSAQAQIPSVTNAGTADNPIGAVEMLVSWKVDTMLRHREGSSSFYIKGDGSFVDLSEDSETP